MIDVSVVIACFNEERHLPQTLDGLVAQDPGRPWEVLFADNGSTDHSAEIFRSYARRHPAIAMRYIDASAQKGKSHALNLAISQARAPAIVLCDADDVPGEGWLGAMARALDAHSFVACRADLDRLNHGWVRHYRPYNASITGLGRTNYPPFASYGGGNTLGFRKAVYERVGLFDPTAEPLEDIDYCIRAQLLGYEIAFVPEAVMHVRFRDTSEGLYRQKYNYSKAAVHLAKRYRIHAPGNRLQRAKRDVSRMRRNLGMWLGILPEYAGLALMGKLRDPLKAAEFRWKLANAAGKLMGMLKYRGLPP